MLNLGAPDLGLPPEMRQLSAVIALSCHSPVHITLFLFPFRLRTDESDPYLLTKRWLLIPGYSAAVATSLFIMLYHSYIFDFYTLTRLDTVQLLHCTSCPAVQAWARLAIGGNVRES